jgi:hypothetical protein
VPDRGIGPREGRLAAQAVGISQLAGPELVEVSGLLDLGPVLAQFGERKVRQHGSSRMGGRRLTGSLLEPETLAGGAGGGGLGGQRRDEFPGRPVAGGRAGLAGPTG